MKHITIISLLFIASISSCRKQEDCPRYFQIPFEISPINSEYHVGDTLSVVSKFSRHVTAFNGEQKEIGTFDMKGISWSPVSFVSRIDSTFILDNPDHALFSTYFEYIIYPDSNFNVLQHSDSGIGLKGAYLYVNDIFYLAYKMVCEKPGIFLLENGSEVYAGHGVEQDFPGRCGRNGFDVWTKMNEGMDNHVDLLKESPDPHWNTWLIQQETDNKLFSKLGGYCFRACSDCKN